MKRRIPQLEIKWTNPEPFALVPIATLDGDRIAAGQQQTDADHKQADQLQSKLKMIP